MSPEPDYFKLTLSIAGGVVIGTLILWVASFLFGLGLVSAIASGLRFTVNEPPASSVTTGALYRNQLRMQQQQRVERIQARTEQHRRDFQNERAQSSRGQRFWAECQEWSANYARTPTDTTRLNGKFYRHRYSQFVQTGRAPGADAPVLETR